MFSTPCPSNSRRVSRKASFLKKIGLPRPLFVYFRSFQTIYRIKTLDFIMIRTRIVRVEGEHADHLTTTTARVVSKLYELGCCLNASFTIFFYILGRWSFRTKALFISLATKPTQLEIMINADQCKWLLTIADNFSVCWRIWPMQPDDL